MDFENHGCMPESHFNPSWVAEKVDSSRHKAFNIVQFR